MIEWLDNIDTELFLFLNGLGHPYLDTVMLWLSDKYIWVPLYLFIIYTIVKKYGKGFWLPLLLVIAAAGLSDFITSGLMKPFFERFRPCRDPEIMEMVVNIGKCGGKYGYASSHAANTTSLGVFIFLLFRNKYAIMLIFWAVLVSYSRIYLGVHYPGDVLTGMLIGSGLSTILYYIGKKTKPQLMSG